ncbi:MAG: SDR family oxidoreductase [Candidatus Omnitrophica bacterium]|nr:SDR family oxidoreductase [Candidatus Omnitrophota bacterium]
MELEGKVALVTGGAKRVGREIALGLAGAGAQVAITYRTSVSDARETLRKIRGLGVKGLALRVDQRSGREVRQAVRRVEKDFGRLDILVNSASSFYPTPLSRVSEAQWEEMIGANLTGPWRFAQAAAAGMLRRRLGRIINIADVSYESPWSDYLPYCAAKGGLVTLTLGLAKALAPHVQANVIAPGPILFPPGLAPRERRRALDRTLLKRPGGPREIAEAVLYLAKSDFVTGVVLPVDGGRRLA